MLAQCYTGNNASVSLLIRVIFRNHSLYNYLDITNSVPVVSHLDSEKIHAFNGAAGCQVRKLI